MKRFERCTQRVRSRPSSRYSCTHQNRAMTKIPGQPVLGKRSRRFASKIFHDIRPISFSAPRFYFVHALSTGSLVLFLPFSPSPSAITTSSAFHFCITSIRPLLMVNAGPTHTMKEAEVGKKGRQEFPACRLLFQLLANQGNGVKRLIHHAVWYLAFLFLCLEAKSFLFLFEK